MWIDLFTSAPPMLNEWFSAFLYALPLILGGVLCLFALVGFWRGLSLRPHEPEHRVKPPPIWWWLGMGS